MDAGPGDPEHVLEGGHANRGLVSRSGDTVRRPRGAHSVLEEAMLHHLDAVGFPYAPRLLGVDDQGRQVLTFIDGAVDPEPAWLHDDRANAAELGRIATVLRDLHDATADFDPPVGAGPKRAIPGPGATWNHADAGYHNIVYRDGRIAALIDWEYVAPGDPLYDAASLVGVSARVPRPDRDDLVRRVDAARLACAAVAVGYGMTDLQRERFPAAIAVMLDDAAAYWSALDAQASAVLRWKAAWFAQHDEELL